MMRSVVLLMSLACTSAEFDSASEEPGIRIEAPDDGAWFDVGTTVSLRASGWHADGATADISTASWMIGAWEGLGSPIDTTELPAGNWDVVVSMEIDGRMVSDEVAIAIWAR